MNGLPWTHLSLLLLVLLVITDVVYRVLITYGYSALDLVMYSIVGALLCGIAYTLYKQKRLMVPTSSTEALFLASTGVLFFVGFLILREAQIRSPNLGLVNAIAYSSVAISIIAMHYLFGDRLTWHAYIGCVFVVTGIFLVVLGNR